MTLAPPEPPLILTVPESVGAFYAVPTGNGSMPAESLVAAGLGQVEASLPRPLPQPLVQVHRVEDLPPLPIGQLAASGASDEQLTRLRSATHLVLVTVGGRPGWPPAHEWIARRLAAGAAQRLGADVVDLLANQVLDLPTVRASLPDAEGLVCLADWVGVEVWPERDGYSCTTSGLRRFGLPELQTLGTPANLVDVWGRAMVGLAGRLLGAWRDVLTARGPTGVSGGGLVALAGSHELTDTDVIEAHVRLTEAEGPRPAAAAAGARRAVTTVRLVRGPGGDPDRPGSYLTIHPPAAATGVAGEPDLRRFLAGACEVLFGQSATARPVTDPALAQAIATARAGLAGVRDRFTGGEFAASTPEIGAAPRPRLLVRYALVADDAHEYIWAYVTSWRDPYLILATSATDSALHPRARAGRPVVLDAAAVIDWAVHRDGAGIVEGAWTRSLA